MKNPTPKIIIKAAYKSNKKGSVYISYVMPLIKGHEAKKKSVRVWRDYNISSSQQMIRDLPFQAESIAELDPYTKVFIYPANMFDTLSNFFNK